MNKGLLFSCILLLSGSAIHAQFTQGNIAVLLTNSTLSNTTASILELSPTTAAQTTPTTYAINGTTGTDAMRFSGSATSTCYLSSTNDNSLLVFTGVNSTTTTGNSNVITTRSVGTFNAAGTYTLAATYTGANGNQPRSATSTDNSTWYIADQGGMYTNGTTAANPAGNFRAAKSFGGTVYVSSASATVIQVNTVSAASAGTVIALPGLAANSSLEDFYMIQSGSNGSSFDVLYVLSATSATVGTIAKYSLVSGSWVANGTYTTAFGGFGLLARPGTGNATLFATTGSGATQTNSVIKLLDAAGYNTAINITTGSNVTLYTTTTGNTLKGIANAPATSSPLAIKLSHFAASNEGTDNLVTWSIAEENKGDYVTLEHSTDAKHFTTLATIAADNQSGTYQFADKAPAAGINYYRLTLVSVDGNKIYSNVVSVSNGSANSNNALAVFPNPVTGNTFSITLKGSQLASPLVINVVNSMGKVIATQTIATNNGTAVSIQLPAGIAAGIYYLNATDGVNTYHQKVIVSK
jgi:hypothetical protein